MPARDVLLREIHTYLGKCAEFATISPPVTDFSDLDPFHPGVLMAQVMRLFPCNPLQIAQDLLTITFEAQTIANLC